MVVCYIDCFRYSSWLLCIQKQVEDYRIFLKHNQYTTKENSKLYKRKNHLK
jgi:hypothetical protein